MKISLLKPDFSGDLISKTGLFLALFAVQAFLGLTFLAYFGKDQLHLFFNQFNSPFWDVFFKYYTDVATTGVLIGLIIFLIWKSTPRSLLTLLFPYVLASLISTFIKRIYFIHIHRPTHYFELKNIPLHEIHGVSKQVPYTFPSGHALSAFILFFFLCLLTKNKSLQLLFGIAAITVSIGRVYLSKHFVLDVVGGSFLGVSIFILCYYLLQKYKNPKWEKPLLKKKNHV